MIKLKTAVNKFLCIILAIALCVTPLMTVCASAVSYPDGVTEENCVSAIPKVDALVNTFVKSSGKDLSETVYEAVLSDDTLNMLFSTVYSELAKNSSSLSVIGVDLSPASLSAALKGFGNVSEKISACGDLNAVVKASSSFSWNVSSKERFGDAMAAMFSPFNKILNALLCGGNVAIAPLVFIKGDDGYSNAIVPILRILLCPDIMTSENFSAEAKKDANSMMRNIVKMIFSAVDKILEKPVDGLCSVLPGVAWYISEGKLSNSLTSLVEPLSLHVGLISIPGITGLLGGIANLEGTEDVSSLLADIDLSAVTGGTKLSLPELDLSELASCGTADGDNFTADKAAAFVTVMRWAVELLRKNSANLGSTLGEAASMVTSLLKKTDDEIIKTLITLLTAGVTIPANNYEWNYPAHTPEQISYTPTLSRETYEEVLNEFDPFIEEVLKESDKKATIHGTLSKTIFSNKIASTLTVAIYKALGSEETAGLLTLLGVDPTPAGVAKAVGSKYPSIARTLVNYSSWEKISDDALWFGFKDGDKDGFKKAVAAVLDQFLPLFNYLLAEKDLTLFDAITLPGADGYNTAMIPLLEALGCKQENIKSYDLYKPTASTNGISDILDPIVLLLDDICRAPIKTACEIIPNIMYFVNSDGIKAVMDNLLYPIMKFLETAGLSDMLPKELTEMNLEINTSEMADKLLEGSDFKIKIPEFDLKKLGNIGTAAQLTSKRTVNGSPVQYTAITSDAPAVLLTVLRFLVDTLSMPENSEMLTGFMSGVMSSSGDAPAETDSPDMMSMYVGNITEKFKAMSTDEIIEWLYNLLFRKTPPVEQKDNDVYVPADLHKVRNPADTAKTIGIIVFIILAVGLIIWFLNSKGYLDEIKEKHLAKKQAKEDAEAGDEEDEDEDEEKPSKKSRKEKKAEKKASKQEAKDKKKAEKQEKKPAAPEQKKQPPKPVKKTVQKPAKNPPAASKKPAVPAKNPPEPEQTPAKTSKFIDPLSDTAPKKKVVYAEPVKKENPFVDPLSDIRAKYAPVETAPLYMNPEKVEKKTEPEKKSEPLDRSGLLMPLSYDKAGEKMAAMRAAEQAAAAGKKTEKKAEKEEKSSAKPEYKAVVPDDLDTSNARSINKDFLDALMDFDSDTKKKN